MWWVLVAFGGSGPGPSAGPVGGPARLVIDGEVVAARHADGFCSWPRVAGVTSEARGDLPDIPWDPVFDPSASLKGFTGLVRGEEPGDAAWPLDLSPSVARPARDASVARGFLEACGLRAIEAGPTAELLRKSAGAARATLVRALITPALEAGTCAKGAGRTTLLAEAVRCDGGACEGLPGALAACH